MTDDMTALADALIETSLAAGRVTLDVYARPFEVSFKADSSPVTDADRRAEALILNTLGRLAPGVPVVAEESAAAGHLPPTGGRFFLVDPLDGTKEFIRRSGDFTVNIALVDAGRPLFGIVYAPAVGRLFVGGPDGAFEVEVSDGRAGARRPIRVRPLPAEGAVLLTSRSSSAHTLAGYRPPCRVVEHRLIGSSLKFCLIAAGEADLYPRLGPTMEWDTAAGDAVLAAAGGCLRTLPEGDPFLYDKRGRPGLVDFLNPSFIASSGRL